MLCCLRADSCSRVRICRRYTYYSFYTTIIGQVYAIAFSPDGKTIASGGDDEKVIVRSVSTGEVVRELEHAGAVRLYLLSDREWRMQPVLHCPLVTHTLLTQLPSA